MHCFPITDALILYECSYTGDIYILVAKYVLYVPSMKNNLTSISILREVGFEMNDKPKIYCRKKPSMENHIIIHNYAGLHI